MSLGNKTHEAGIDILMLAFKFINKKEKKNERSNNYC